MSDIVSGKSIETKVMVGNAVFEKVVITKHDEALYVVFFSEELDDIAIPIDDVKNLVEDKR